MALSDIGRAWTFARKIEDLLELQQKTSESLAIIDQRLKALEDRMTRIEARQEQVFTEARNAATVMASGIIADAVTRITRLEGRADQLERNVWRHHENLVVWRDNRERYRSGQRSGMNPRIRANRAR